MPSALGRPPVVYSAAEQFCRAEQFKRESTRTFSPKYLSLGRARQTGELFFARFQGFCIRSPPADRLSNKRLCCFETVYQLIIELPVPLHRHQCVLRQLRLSRFWRQFDFRFLCKRSAGTKVV
ncbi:Hypothetical_protein [Hexamita inflata]|uniref:Hypothetical_protein n=1 Tax=Hexamita inflata TaxID=28002 RepID=A0AA86RBF7_9EUKA|nr:Hypothetical protein HINF_LOCUS57413 [Hexamita inflata]